LKLTGAAIVRTILSLWGGRARSLTLFRYADLDTRRPRERQRHYYWKNKAGADRVQQHLGREGVKWGRRVGPGRARAST
jgi:hypothetical protein